MGGVLQDLRYAVRTFASRPGFTIIAIVSLALGIGANSGVFSLVDALFLRPPAIERPRELVWISSRLPEGQQAEFSYVEYLDIRPQATVLSDLAAYSHRGGFL